MTDETAPEQNSQGPSQKDLEADLLYRMIEAMGLCRGEFAIHPAFEPSQNQFHRPTPAWYQKQRPLIQAKIEAMKPNLVIFLGLPSAKVSLEQTPLPWQKNHGRILTFPGTPNTKALLTLHPRDLLRFPLNKKLAWSHLKTAIEFLETAAKTQMPH